AENQLPFLFLNENESHTELPRHFLANDKSTHRRRNHSGYSERPDFSRERRAEFFDDGHLLKRERALKKLPAVKGAAENEMAFEQGACIAENLQNFVFGHWLEFQVLSFQFQVICSPEFAF